jgi:hypothetical protein
MNGEVEKYGDDCPSEDELKEMLSLLSHVNGEVEKYEDCPSDDELKEKLALLCAVNEEIEKNDESQK